MSASWLPLTDYSTKYRVSVSTLRRKIKAEDIQFKLDDGKYYIIDEPLESSHRPSQESEVVTDPKELHLKALSQLNQKSKDEPILTAANRLLSELKKAYTQILQEKEEQILDLKAEVADLKTLVRVLEGENERLQRNEKGRT